MQMSEMQIVQQQKQWQEGLRCNKVGCRILLPTPGSRTGWVTYCSHLFCGPCGRECATQGVCLACQTDLSLAGHRDPAKISRVNLAPNDKEKQMMLAGMLPSDILDVAKAGIQFYEHQREFEVRLMGLRIASQDKKIEAARQFNEEMVNHYKSHITKLELEKEDLRREKEELRREMSRNIHKTRLGVGGAQSLQLSLQYNGQVEDDSPTIGVQQANQIAAFDPEVEEIELDEMDEEDFAPPPATSSHKGNFQARPLSGGKDWSFGGISSSRKLQVRVEKVDMARWKLNQSRSIPGSGRSNQGASQPWASGAMRMSGGKRGQNMQEENLHLRNGKSVRTCLPISPLRLF